MTQRSAKLVVAIVCIAGCGSALAERSLLLDPGEASEAGNCELDVAAERQTARDAPAQQEASVQLDCGIGWGTELTVAAARRRGDGPSAWGLALEGKTNLGFWGIDGLAWALEYGVAGERSGNAGWRWREQYLALAAAYRPAADWALEARLGTVRDRIERRNSTLWSLTVEHEFDDALEAKVEVAASDGSRPVLGVELRWEFWPDRARLNLFYGGRAGSERERVLGAGVSFEF